MTKKSKMIIIIGIISVLILTNPNEQDYKDHVGVIEDPPQNLKLEVERTNLLLFSVYIPVVRPIDEHGTTVIGVFGNFIKLPW